MPATEVLSHRIVWSTVFLMGLLVLRQRFQQTVGVLRVPKQIDSVLTTTILACIWGLYIFGVNSGRVVKTSLSYCLNPLVNVLLRLLFLQEKPNRTQMLAVVLAALGVVIFICQRDSIPWLALALAFSFGAYGLLQKSAAIAPVAGLTVETLLMTPLSMGMISYGSTAGLAHWGHNETLTALFIGCGAVTSLPLLWFNTAAKRLRLAILGFFYTSRRAYNYCLG